MTRRKDFPIFSHNLGLVYLDSAATSQKPQSVIDAVNEYYETYNANIHRGIYPIAEKATQAVESVRRKVAAFIGASSPDEIVFTKGTTESINLVMYAWGMEYIHEGDVIVTTVLEHHANFVPWQQLAQKKKAVFRVVDITDDGVLDEAEVLRLVKGAKLFAFSSVSNMLGTIMPTQALIKKIRKVNPTIVILIDAAQEIPHARVDVETLDCDFLAFSGHKMLSETGVGVLYGKKALLQSMPPFLYGGAMIQEVSVEQTSFAPLPYKFEAGTSNISGIISLGAAIAYLEDIGFSQIEKDERALMRYCFERLREVEGISLFGPKKLEQRGGIVAFAIDGVHAHDVAQLLGDRGVCVRAGHHCTMPLHTRLNIAASVRASFYVYNSESDIDQLIAGLKMIKKVFQ